MGGDGILEFDGQPVAREGAGEGDGADAAVLVGLGSLEEARRGGGVEGEAEAEQVVERGVVAVRAAPRAASQARTSLPRSKPAMLARARTARGVWARACTKCLRYSS